MKISNQPTTKPMTKNVTILFAIIFFQCSVSAQTLKIYNGVFKTNSFNGNASYQYFDNSEGERTFEGPFKFTATNNLVSISGKYQNNLKNGLWKYTLNNYLYSDLMLNYNINSTSTGNYSNGKLEGGWNLQRTKTVSSSSNGISQYYRSQLNSLSYLLEGKNIDFSKKQTIVENSLANFSDNHFVGNFVYSVNNGKSKVTGQFDNRGLMQGLWVVTYFSNGIPVEEKSTYLNGVLLTIKRRDNSTGDLTVAYDNEAEVKEFFQNYNSQENSSYVKETFYALESVKPNSDGTVIDNALSIWLNNTSLSKSSYTFEVKQGLIAITDFPQKKIVIDNEKNQKKQRDDEAKAEELEKKKEAEAEEKRQIQIAKENQERKIRYEQEQKKRDFERSDYGQLRKQIKIEFSAWLEKKEFENQQDYENRVKTNSQSELTKIIEKKISESKKSATDVLSAALQDYNIDNETFLVKLFGEYSREINTNPIYINIPKSIAENLKTKFGSQKADLGSPLLAHILDVAMIDNKWTPSKVLIIFPNGERRSSGNFDNAYYDAYYWNKTHIKDNGNGQYTLAYSGNISLKPLKLKNINTQFKSSSLDDGVFFYEWQLNNNSSNPFDFTLENLEIKLPY